MTSSRWRTSLGAMIFGVAVAIPVRAALVDFEDVTPTFLFPTVSSGPFDFTTSGIGFSGVDSAAAFSGNAPPNAMGQFLFMLNADGVNMKRTDGGGFILKGFDAAFIQPVPGLGGTSSPGELHVSAVQADGDPVSETFLFAGADGSGNYNFAHFGTGALGAEALKSADFSACIYLPDNSCSFDPLAQDVPPQYALDNIDTVATTPEPATAVLALGALGIMALRRRRRTI